MSNSTGLTGLLPHPHGNATLFNNPDLCTFATCDLTLAHVDYLPSLPGNTLFAALFAICFFTQFILGIKYRTWGFLAATTLGMLTEIIGYIGRIMMHNNPFSKNNFLMYLVTLTIAPAFLSAAIYLCLARIVVVYGEERSRFKPRTYTILFCSSDFLALLLQAAGGAIASISNTQSGSQTGINIMLAGLCFQVFSLLLFSAACLEFGVRIYTSTRTPGHPYANNANSTSFPHALPPQPNSPTSIRSGTPLHSSLTETRLFGAFLIGLGVATLAIFIRSCFRVSELSGGFHGKLANNQVSFMILEGAMVIIACLTLTVLHPGPCFSGEWRSANFKLGKGKGNSSNDTECKRTSMHSIEEVETDTVDPPQYSESLESLDADTTAGDGEEASNRIASPRHNLRATTVRATPVRPGDVHLEMMPVYGVRYENTSDEFPRPLSYGGSERAISNLCKSCV